MNRSMLSVLVVVGMVGITALVFFFWPKPDKQPPPTTSSRPQFDVTEFNPFSQAPRSFRAIVEPESSSVEVAGKQILPKELVLGVEVNGVARAYPINMLTGPEREIINDELGGKAIAATW